LSFQDRSGIFARREAQLEPAASIEIAKQTLLAGGLILSVGILTGLLAQKIRIPDVAVFLVVGMALGPEMLGWIHIRADSALNQLILLFGASYILFDRRRVAPLQRAEAGLDHDRRDRHARRRDHRRDHRPRRVLRARRFRSSSRCCSAAALASTDPATLVPIFRQIHIRDRVAQTVVSESALNDATGAVLTFGVLAIAMGTGEFSLAASLADLAKQSIIGIVAGVVLVGTSRRCWIAHERYAFLAEYAPVVTLVAVIGAYFAADGLQASGFMAVFVFGLVLGNKDSFGFQMEPGEAQKLDEYVMTTAFIMRLFIFILLGSQVDFSLMNRYLVGGVIVVTIFMLVARPIAVFVCALPDRRARWTFQEMLFMCWTRETGVIPAALAGLLLGMKAPGAQMIASVTFIAILMTILIQAPTTKWLGARLGLLEEKRAG
jgi:cell volume regulation protein A